MNRTRPVISLAHSDSGAWRTSSSEASGSTFERRSLFFTVDTLAGWPRIASASPIREDNLLEKLYALFRFMRSSPFVCFLSRL